MSSIKIKAESSFYANDVYQDDYQQTPSDEEGIYYTKRYQNQRFPSSKYNKRGNNHRQEKPNVRTKADNSRKPGKTHMIGMVAYLDVGHVKACIIGNKTAQKNRTTPTWYMKSSFIMKVISQVNSNIWCQKLGTVVYSIAVLVKQFVWMFG